MFKAVNRYIYGPTPEERLAEWQRRLRTEQRGLEKEIRQLDLATSKARAQLKQLAQRGDIKSARLLAREVVRTGRQRQRLAVGKARLGSVQMQMQHQAALVKVTGTFQKSTEIMKASNELVKLPQLSATMREMSAEMMKSGIISEMIDDTLEMDEDSELEDEADEEVDKVLYELTDGKLGQAGAVADSALPATKEQEEEDVNTEAEMQRMQRELQDLLTG
ncbi:Vacuolar protein-sorting-associated protein 24 [Naganishia albida]|nr:Vacuolar protein-sorting-associated protein 24 [Naganishia albida]